MEAAGDRWWPISGGVYFLQAVKHMHGMHIIKPGWKNALAGKKRMAAVTQNCNENRSKKNDKQPLIEKNNKSNE